ncbi:MAG: phosphatidate cytidylyltransferase [Paludibacteraceae bacterium]|nr:phosphatidate cytidylyltransferase [Paludibacteraceae bacterium]
MSELVKRTLSGTVYVACIVCCILWDVWAVSGLLLLVSLLAVDEFHRLVKSHSLQRVYAALGVVMLWLMSVFHEGMLVLAFAAVYMPILVLSLLDEIWNHAERPLEVWGNMLISQIMIAAPILTLPFLYSLDKWLLLALFVIIWINDTGAYCVGTLTAKRPQGNHKMAPHVSPKKSWEGLFGGMAFAIGGAFILNRFGWFESIQTPEPSLWIAGLFGFFVSVFGTLGDLMESLFKRSIGVKDSGRFLPGHGGVLDRFDSILLASPILTAYCWLCYFIVPLL